MKFRVGMGDVLRKSSITRKQHVCVIIITQLFFVKRVGPLTCRRECLALAEVCPL